MTPGTQNYQRSDRTLEAMYDHILVPTDGSEHAQRATEHGALIADAFDATLHLLSVVDVSEAAGPFSAGGVDDAYVEQLTDASESELAEISTGIERVDTVETAVTTGRPSAGILEYVDEEGIDLVCMGTHGRRGLRRFLTGSVTERVVRLSPVPVLTVRAVEASEPGDGYDDILVPTDGSDCAQAAVAHALALAERFDSRLHAVSVIDTASLATGTEMGIPPGLLEQLEENAAEATRAIEDAAGDAGVDCVGVVDTGGVRRVLLNYAEEHDIDLVCLGTHGRSGLDRVLVGSTAEGLVRRADAPVVTVSQRRGGESDSTE